MSRLSGTNVPDQLEPAAVELIAFADDQLVAVASIAISLKRLADIAESVIDPAWNLSAIRTRRD